MMRQFFAILAIVTCAAAGCDTRAPSTRESSQPLPPSVEAKEEVVDERLQPRYGWYESDDGEAASHTLVAILTIPDVFTDKKREIRTARYLWVDGERRLQGPPRCSAINECAEKGGFGYSGSISLCEDEDENRNARMFLDVNYFWTTSDQVKGELTERVLVEIGVPTDFVLGRGARLHVRWQIADEDS